MNQNVSVKQGKHRHVSANTITASRLHSNRKQSSIVKIVKEEVKPSYPTRKNKGFFGKLFSKLFKRA